MENKPATLPPSPEGQRLIYRDGVLCVQVRMDGRMIWLTQRLMAELYQVTVVNINQHPKAIYAEGGFFPEATTKQFLNSSIRTEVPRYRSRQRQNCF